ncbi:MAG: LpxL/LpxP family Kdo(2)-lipid IV(A) lauroyl/palmitoleoyl acyltransferase [Pseudomonadota bacterium]|mgnify:CR=1 FL=1
MSTAVNLHSPRFWPVWLGFSILRLVSWLPFRLQLWLGRGLGRLVLRFSSKRVHIARRNLEYCFPNQPEEWIDKVLHAHFENLGMSVFEMAMAWYRPQRLAGRWRFEGIEHLEAHTPGPVILLTGHFGALEVGGTALNAEGLIFDAVYREDRNPLVTELVRRGRERSGRRTIEKASIKQMVRSLRDNVPVWYAPDQSYRRKHSALIDFFGVPAMTNTATTTLAKLGKAQVIGFFPHRRSDYSGYDITITAPMSGIPSDDAVADTIRMVGLLEDNVRRSPEQYFWVHRKFKGRPEPLPDVYRRESDTAA